MKMREEIEESERIARIHLTMKFDVKILSSYVKPPGLLGKDIDIYILLSSVDYKKVLGGHMWSESLVYNSKPLDLFITDGKKLMVGEQVSPQEIKFTESPSVMRSRRLKLSRSIMRSLEAGMGT